MFVCVTRGNRTPSMEFDGGSTTTRNKVDDVKADHNPPTPIADDESMLLGNALKRLYGVPRLKHPQQLTALRFAAAPTGDMLYVAPTGSGMCS